MSTNSYDIKNLWTIVPSHWSTISLKYLCSQSALYGANVNSDTYKDHGVRFIRTTDIREDGILENEGVYIAEELVGDHILQDGDLIISRSGTVGRAFLYSSKYGSCAYAGYLVRFILNSRQSPKYYFYITKSLQFQLWLGTSSIESTIGNVNGEKYSNFRVPNPPLPEQKAIASYLDEKTAKIDELITTKKQLLELLAEKRRALITHAVTRGLNSDVPMRDSGIEWLGDIPKHWNRIRLRYLTKETLAYGANEAALEDNPHYPRFIRITDINEDGSLRPETFKSLSPEVAELYLLDDGDILLARSGATVGKAFIYKQEWGSACFAGYLIRFRCNQEILIPSFLFYYTQANIYWLQVYAGTIQATIQNFSAEKYGEIIVAVPPLQEQKEIVKYLHLETQKLDNLRLAAQEAIKLLQERRTALITEAVTGQIQITG